MVSIKKNKFSDMGKVKGLRLASAFGLMVAATVSITACGGNDSGTGTPVENISESSSSVFDGVSSSSVSFDSAYFGPVEHLSSSDMKPIHSSSSNIIPGSSSDVIPGDGREPGDNRDPGHEQNSSGMEPSHSSITEPPRSSSSEPPKPLSSSSEKVYPQYSKILGADVSQMQEYEANGVRVLDTDGTVKDIFEVLREHGFNYIRLKTFVSPNAKYGYASAGCNQGAGAFPQNVEAFGDKDHVIAYAKRAKAAGFKLLLDFHYSDNWADPGKQIIPERWRNVKTSDAMADSVYAYTLDVLTALKNANALPEMVQVGNEITNGMLRELPTSSTDCWGNKVQSADAAVSGVMSNATGIANTAKYLAAGSRAVKQISNNIKTVFHIESPHKTSTMEWWMKSIIQNSKVAPDVMAFSAYTAYEHGNPDSWKTLMTNLGKTYTNLEFLIAEYNGAQTKDSYNFDGSRVKTIQIMDEIPRGLGAFIWEPERSGEWGTAMFDWVGNDLKANKQAFDEYNVLFR